MLFINSNRAIDIFVLADLIYDCALYKIHDYLKVNNKTLYDFFKREREFWDFNSI